MYQTILFVLTLVACGEALPRTSLVKNPDHASAEVREACAVTELKCTRCHTVGRIISFEATSRAQWEPIVTRMRQMTSSGISKSDAEVVLQCLGEPRGAPTSVQSRAASARADSRVP
ncbi:MAG: hypothetical protein JWP01_1428 [Myxococcales bacterium]|nr:hypothetical protein [Myxococcales bacterium]